jgi:hypothetical protein
MRESASMATDGQAGTRWHAVLSIAREDEEKSRGTIERIAFHRVPAPFLSTPDATGRITAHQKKRAHARATGPQLPVTFACIATAAGNAGCPSGPGAAEQQGWGISSHQKKKKPRRPDAGIQQHGEHSMSTATRDTSLHPVGADETPLARLVRRMAGIFAEHERAVLDRDVQKTPPNSAESGD